MSFANPHYLVETDWLEEHLNDANLRILDCNVLLVPEDAGGFRMESGRPAWGEGHIGGSDFADFTTDLSDQNSTLPLMMPPLDQFADALSRYGVSAQTRVFSTTICIISGLPEPGGCSVRLGLTMRPSSMAAGRNGLRKVGPSLPIPRPMRVANLLPHRGRG